MIANKKRSARPEKVLIVDDSRIMRDFLRNMLVELGFNHFIEASGARDALFKFEVDQPHFIFLDIDLGEDNGLDIFKRILEQDQDAKVTIISAHSTVDNVKQAMQLGAKGFLVKPFNPTKLVAAVKNMSQVERLAKQ